MKIINVIASSLDGCIAAGPLETDEQRLSYHLTSKADQEFVRERILDADAIITGAESVRASGSLRSERNRQGDFPLWAILTTSGLDKNLEFWNQVQFERWMVSPNPIAMHDKKVVNQTYGLANAAEFLASKLKDRGVETALLFGGGKMNALFYAAGLVDELYLTLSPVIIGSSEAVDFFDTENLKSNLPSPQIMQLKNVKQVHNQLFLHYSIKR